MAFIRSNLQRKQYLVVYRTTLLVSVNGPQLTIDIPDAYPPPKATEDIIIGLYGSTVLGAGLTKYSTSLFSNRLYISVYNGSALFAADSNSIKVVLRYLIGSK